MYGLRFVLAACVFWSAPCLSNAQIATGEISGFVSGPRNTGLAGAHVSVLHPESGTEVSVIAGGRGAYRVPGLHPGTYQLKAEIAGFEAQVKTDVVLTGGEAKVINFDLPIAALHEVITVIGPAPGDSLEAAQIRESSARDVGEALASMPGVWMLRKGGIANDVVLRGFQSRDLNILIDGLRIYGACPNHMDPPAFHADFAEVDRIELGKGPFDVRNQGSLGGVVNIVTRRAERGFHADADFSTGSFGYFNPSATASYGSERYSFLGGFSYRLSKPYTDGAGKRFTDSANYRAELLDSDAFRVGTGWGKISLVPRAGHLAQIAYTRQQADHVLYPYLQMDAVYDDSDRVGLSYQMNRVGSFVHALRFHGYFSQVDHWMTDQYRLTSLGVARAYSMGTMAETRTYGGRFELAMGNWTIGSESFRRRWNTTTALAGSGYQNQYSLPDVRTDSIGIYAAYQKPLTDSLRLDAGARFDTARSVADPLKANTSLYYAYHSTRSTAMRDAEPSGNVRLRYSAPHGFEISGGVGHTARIPEPQERYFALRRMGSDWVGNPGIEPSRNTGADATVTFRHSGLFLASAFHLDRVRDYITIYRQPKVNMVAGIMNSSARSYQNVDARLYGGELEAAYALTQRLFFAANLSYVRGSQDPGTAAGITSNNLPEMPPLYSRTGLRYATNRLSAEIEGLFTGAQRRTNADLGEEPTPGYATANAKLTFRVRRFALRAAVNNLFGRRYYEYLSYQRDPFRTGVHVFEPGRNVYLNISYRF